MPRRTHLEVIEEYFAQYGRLVAGERSWLELAYMTATGAERPAEIVEMILALKGRG